MSNPEVLDIYISQRKNSHDPQVNIHIPIKRY